MGCDIHLYLETKHGAAWQATNLYERSISNTFIPVQIYRGRDYRLFGILANVRYQPEAPYYPLSVDKGIPNDVSSTLATEYEAWGDHAHSPGHLTLEELQNADVRHRLLGDRPLQHLLDAINNVASLTHGLPRLPSDIRVVFWFDN